MWEGNQWSTVLRGKGRPRPWASAWARPCPPVPWWPLPAIWVRARQPLPVAWPGCWVFPGRVTSPTFTIVNEYEGGRLPLFHFDMYRLGGSDELFDIGWEDYLRRGGVCAVEWSETVSDALEGCIRVDIRRGEGENDRIITICEGDGT